MFVVSSFSLHLLAKSKFHDCYLEIKFMKKLLQSVAFKGKYIQVYDIIFSQAWSCI